MFRQTNLPEKHGANGEYQHRDTGAYNLPVTSRQIPFPDLFFHLSTTTTFLESLIFTRRYTVKLVKVIEGVEILPFQDFLAVVNLEDKIL